MPRLWRRRFLFLPLTLLTLSLPNDTSGITHPATSPVIDPHGPPPPLPENPPPVPPSPASPDLFSRTSLRHFVSAFLRARGAQSVDQELGFFAARAEYLGRPHASREEIRRDLLRIREQWPERHFSLAGELAIENQKDGRTRVSFSVRYQLRKGATRRQGEVRQALVLTRTSPYELQIVALQERQPGT